LLAAPVVTAVLGQPAVSPLLTAVPTITAPVAVGPVNQLPALGVRPELISFSQLAIPGSQASPMAQLPPVPFPYITGPVLPAPGPANAIPTFAVDVARVNQGVGGAVPEQNTATGMQQGNPPAQPSPVRPSQPPSLLIPPVLLKPVEESQEPGTEQAPRNKPPDAQSAVDPTWAEVSAAYFAREADPAPARPELPALPLSIDEDPAPEASAVVGLVAVLAGAFWEQPGRPSREPQAKRRNRLSAWITPI